MISSAWLRPDLIRVYKVYEAGGSEEASSALCRLMAEGAGVGYQLSDELPGDRTFAYSVAEVIYVERMGARTLGGVGAGRPPTLRTVGGGGAVRVATPLRLHQASRRSSDVQICRSLPVP